MPPAEQFIVQGEGVGGEIIGDAGGKLRTGQARTEGGDSVVDLAPVVGFGAFGGDQALGRLALGVDGDVGVAGVDGAKGGRDCSRWEGLWRGGGLLTCRGALPAGFPASLRLGEGLASMLRAGVGPRSEARFEAIGRSGPDRSLPFGPRWRSG